MCFPICIISPARWSRAQASSSAAAVEMQFCSPSFVLLDQGDVLSLRAILTWYHGQPVVLHPDEHSSPGLVSLLAWPGMAWHGPTCPRMNGTVICGISK